MPAEIIADIVGQGGDVEETENLLSEIDQADVIYMTRIQKERFPDEDEYLKVADAYKLHARDLDDAKSEMIIMHPLPRVEEIHPSVDGTRYARYFQQAFNGVVTRMSLMCWLLKVAVPDDVIASSEVIA